MRKVELLPTQDCEAGYGSAIKQLINGNQVQRRDNRVGDNGNDHKDSAEMGRKQQNYNIIITLLKYSSY